MTNKNVDDYLTEGMYGIRRPKEAERQRFLGSLRERVVIALTIGQVMTDSGVKELDEAMKKHPTDTKLLINGHIGYSFFKKERELATKHNISYTVITNEEYETDIGAVLVYSYAINKENIFIEEVEEQMEPANETPSFFTRMKKWFT